MRKMRRRRRVQSNVVEVVVLTRLLGGSCLQPSRVCCDQRLLQPVCGSRSSRVWTPGCTNDRLNRSQLSFAPGSDAPRRESSASFQGFVQPSHVPPRGQLRTTCRSTSGDDSSGVDEDDNDHGATMRDHKADQEVWAGEWSGATAAGGEAMVGSPEFVALLKAQFSVLVSVLGVERVVLFARRENAETGATTCFACGVRALLLPSFEPSGALLLLLSSSSSSSSLGKYVKLLVCVWFFRSGTGQSGAVDRGLLWRSIAVCGRGVCVPADLV